MLQTVYESCTTGDVGAWSPDGRKIAFTEPATSISVLDLASGRLQRFPLGSGLVSYQPAFWADNQHLLVERSSPIDDSQIEVDLLDMSEGTEQTAHKVTSITSIPTFCGQIAPGEHGSQLFRSSCTPFGGYCHGRQVQGPSNVSVLPATGGTVRTVYSSPSRAVTAIAYAGSSSLLIYIETTSGDLSQNGLWKINTDGSDLTRLTATKVLTCQYTQYAYPLTQVSSDGARYALLYMDEGEQKLIVGSLAGGSSTTISAHQFSNVNILLLVGMGIF
jgi:Tol biopolymer transport system component